MNLYLNRVSTTEHSYTILQQKLSRKGHPELANRVSGLGGGHRERIKMPFEDIIGNS